MAALDNEKIARGALLAAMETGKSLREKEEEEERKRRELQEQALSEYQEDNRDRFRQSGFAKEADRTAGIVGRGLVSNIIDSLVATNPNAPSKLETTGRLLYADEQGNMPEGQTGAGVLYSNLGQAIATDEANAHAEQNMGTPTEIASVELNPSNKPAFNPASSYVQEENPSAGIQKQAEDFAAEMTKNKTQSAPEGVLDNVESNVDNSKGRESFGSDFFSAMATLATFGGMIATGVGIPFALAAAAGAWTGTEPYRQRESSASGLRKQGYSDAEITNFVYDGVLNQTPNAQVQADAKENLEIKRAEKQSLIDAREAKTQASQEKGSGGIFGFNTPEVRQVIQTTRTYLNDVGLKAARFDQAYESATSALQAYDKGDYDLAGKAGQGAMEAHAKAMQGGSGAVSPQVAEEYGGNPNWFKNMYEKARRGVTGSYSREELERLKRSAELSKQAEHAAIDSRLQDMYWNFVQKGEDPEKVFQLVKGLAAGSGAYDWYPRQRTKKD